VVTTRKVEEQIQDVPVAITAFSSVEIQEARIENLDDVAALTPGLNFFNPFGDILPVPVIRGIAPTDIFGEPNAAIFVDGVYAAGREGLNFAMLDVERIEVVKGPQSALYGRNAFSGAINYVTKRPTDEFESSVEVTGGNRGRFAGKAHVSGPLIENTLGIRVGVGYDTWDGSYDNPISSEDVGGNEFKTITAGLNWTPTDNFDALLQTYFSHDEIDESPMTGQFANCENVGENDGENSRLANLCGEVWDLDRVAADANQGIIGNPNIPEELQFRTGSEEIGKIAGSTGEERDVSRASLNMNWDVGAGVITSLTGYSRVEHESIVDGTRNLGYTFPFVYCDDVGGYANQPGDDSNTLPFCDDWNTPQRFTTGEFIVSPKNTTKEISQELRFAGPQDGSVRYSVGGYYFKFKNTDTDAAVLASAPSLPDGLGDPTGPGTEPPGAAFGPWPGFGIAIGDAAFRPWFTPTSTLGEDETVISRTDSYAAFSTLDWDITDSLTADFQLRYTYDKKDYKLTAPALSSARSADEDFEFLTGRAGLKYTFNDNLMIYGSISNGTKSGGFDADVVDVTDPDTGVAESRIVIVPFDEEKLISYELGAKGSTPNGMFRYDVAVYLMDWKDIVIPQVFANDPITGDPLEQPEGFNTNAGDATVYGIETQGDLAITNNLFAGFGVSYTDATMDNAKLESFADLPSFSPDGDVSNNTMLRQPEWQANGNVRYIQPLGSDWQLNSRADITYQDKYYGGLDNQWTIPSHTYVNLRLALESDRWSISLWGKNVFNNDAPIAAFRDVYFGNTDDPYQQEPASSTPEKFFPWRITSTQPRLRTYGLTANVRFGT
jgi:iron complex outermembrane receptor protein